MRMSRRALIVLAASAPASALASPCCGPVTPSGARLVAFLDGTGVDRLWLAGDRVNWETGVSVGPWRDDRPHTHCSAFVASAAKRLGVYVLRPPDHGTVLLANAQMGWLQQRRGDGRRLAFSARRHFGANARQSGRSRSGGFPEPGSGQTRAYRDRPPIRHRRGDAARTRAVRRSGGGPQRILDAAQARLRQSPERVGARRKRRCAIFRPRRELGVIRLEQDEIWLRHVTLTLPLRGFPLPVGEGRPLPPRGEGGRASGRMRVFGAIDQKSSRSRTEERYATDPHVRIGAVASGSKDFIVTPRGRSTKRGLSCSKPSRSSATAKRPGAPAASTPAGRTFRSAQRPANGRRPRCTSVWPARPSTGFSPAPCNAPPGPAPRGLR